MHILLIYEGVGEREELENVFSTGNSANTLNFACTSYEM